MKKILSLIGVAALLATGILSTGCATAPAPETIATYIGDARDIAELGTMAVLLEKPALRPQLELTRDALATLAGLPEGEVSVDDLLAALAKLPIEQLQSDKGRIYVTGGRIIVRRFVSLVSKPEIDVGASGYVQQFARALVNGMDAALSQQ